MTLGRGERRVSVRRSPGVGAGGDPDGRSTTSTSCRQMTVRVTSTLPRVALEYGHTSWAFSTRASAVA